MMNFIKAEIYGKVTEDRMISTIKGEAKRRYSAYMYAYTAWLKSVNNDVHKRVPWYAFCQCPRDVAQRVAAICKENNVVIETDASRMDGTISELVRHFERMFLLAVYHPDHHAEIIELHREQYGAKCTVQHLGDEQNVKYYMEWARASGSPETSWFNTFMKAFCMYLSKRFELRSPGPSAHQRAWDALGMYGGDDGITGWIDPACIKRSAAAIGLNIEMNYSSRPDAGNGSLHAQMQAAGLDRENRYGRVKFLARVFGPDVWRGDPTSCCDIPRMLSKLHVTRASTTFTNREALYAKALGLLFTDMNTPLVGAIAAAIFVAAQTAQGPMGGGMMPLDTVLYVDRDENDPDNFTLGVGINMRTEDDGAFVKEDIHAYILGLRELCKKGLVSWWAEPNPDLAFPNDYDSAVDGWMEQYLDDNDLPDESYPDVKNWVMRGMFAADFYHGRRVLRTTNDMTSMTNDEFDNWCSTAPLLREPAKVNPTKYECTVRGENGDEESVPPKGDKPVKVPKKNSASKPRKDRKQRRDPAITVGKTTGKSKPGGNVERPRSNNKAVSSKAARGRQPGRQ
jgi:hypothetical protein